MEETVVATPAKCRAAETNATLSSCFGFSGEVTLTDSAVIILFAGMLGAGEMFSMITTSLLPLLNGVCIIPMAWLATRMGSKPLILRACALAGIAYFAAVASAFCGGFSVAVLIGSILIFAFCQTGFIAGWFPFVDTFLTKDRRTIFFSRMRFSHQVTAVSFLVLIGLIIGHAPPLWKLQIVLLLGAIIFCGRIFFISRIPVFGAKHEDPPGDEKMERAPGCRQPDAAGFKEGLMAAIGNKPLSGFSVYLFMLNLAAFGTIPLTTLYLKMNLHAADNVIVLISAMTLAGMILGYYCACKIITRWRIRGTLLCIHISYILVNLMLFFISDGNSYTYVLIALLLFIYSFMTAVASIVSSSEMMALTTAGNKAVAMAFCGAFSSGGCGLSRLVTSLILGSGMLAAEWHIGAMKICHYQTLFLAYAVAVSFAAIFLVVVPAIFPKGEYLYDAQ